MPVDAKVYSESIAEIFGCDTSTKLELPFQSCPVPAGFPSPAEDYVEIKLDLNVLLVEHPASTYFVKASGQSMIGASINHGDILVVDRSLNAKHGDIVIAVVEGEVTVKRLHYLSGEIALVPENDRYETIAISEHSELHIWGVVTNVIHSVKKKAHHIRTG
jgi:DNA polymerase V